MSGEGKAMLEKEGNHSSSHKPLKSEADHSPLASEPNCSSGIDIEPAADSSTSANSLAHLGLISDRQDSASAATATAPSCSLRRGACRRGEERRRRRRGGGAGGGGGQTDKSISGIHPSIRNHRSEKRALETYGLGGRS